MVIVDANVLLYAVNEASPHHRAAKKWIDVALGGDEPVGLAWVVLLAFLRLVTLPAVFPKPLGVDVALEVVEAWLSARAATVVQPTAGHAAVLGGFLRGSGTAGNPSWTPIWRRSPSSTVPGSAPLDRDFARFPGLQSFAPA